MFTTKLLGYLTIALLVVACITFAFQINKAGYDQGYEKGYDDAWEQRDRAYDNGYEKGYHAGHDDGYQACVEEYNLYLPYE